MTHFFLSLFLLLNFTCTKVFSDDGILPARICSPTECYTVIKKLGGGAFAEVFLVENSSRERFALKRYYRQDKHNQGPSFLSVLSDVKREFNHGQMFRHPNIIKSFELFEEESLEKGRTYNLLLELVDGDTVKALERKSLSEKEALSAAEQLVDVLSYAFSLDYIYLDLHPGNIMLDDSGQIKVVDLASFFSWEEIFAMINNLFQGKASRGLDPAIMDPIRQKKFDQFIANHSEFFARIAQRQHQSAGLVAKGIELEEIKKEISQLLLSGLSDFCIKILMKSNCEREKKLKLYAEIKNVVWNFEEDIEENKNCPMESYLDNLHTLLKSIL